MRSGIYLDWMKNILQLANRSLILNANLISRQWVPISPWSFRLETRTLCILDRHMVQDLCENSGYLGRKRAYKIIFKKVYKTTKWAGKLEQSTHKIICSCLQQKINTEQRGGTHTPRPPLPSCFKLTNSAGHELFVMFLPHLFKFFLVYIFPSLLTDLLVNLLQYF